MAKCSQCGHDADNEREKLEIRRGKSIDGYCNACTCDAAGHMPERGPITVITAETGRPSFVRRMLQIARYPFATLFGCCPRCKQVMLFECPRFVGNCDGWCPSCGLTVFGFRPCRHARKEQARG